MTVPSTTNRLHYTGNGVTTAFAYPAKIFTDADLVVTVDGVTQTLTTHYTVTNAGSANGGNVVFVTAPADAAVVSIRRVVELTQDTRLRNQSSYSPNIHEDAFDRGAMADQQQQDGINRSIKIPDTEDPSEYTLTLPVAATRANGAIVFDADGNMEVDQNVATSTAAAEAAATAAAASEAAALTSENNAEDWATLTGALVEATDYSSKEYAIGTFVPAGSSKEWANTAEDVQVGDAAGFSALHYSAKAQAAAAALTIPDTVIYYHPQTQLTDVTVPDGYNAWVVGPFTIDAGATLTVGAGSNFYVQPDPSTLVQDTEADVEYLTPATAASTYAPKAFRGALVLMNATGTGATSVPVTTTAALAFPYESYDTEDFHDNVTNNTRLTIPAGISKIRLSANLFVSGSTAVTSCGAQFTKNGARSPGFFEGRTRVSWFTRTHWSTIVSPVLNVTAGDYFEVDIDSPQGDAVSVSHETWFAIEVVE